MAPVAVLHVVLLQPRPGIAGAAVTDLWEAMHGLSTAIDGVEHVACGPNTSPEPLAQGYTLGFVVRFANAAARDAYLPHPAHQAVVPLVQAVAERVLVFDLETFG
jgi:hypothetical protein